MKTLKTISLLLALPLAGLVRIYQGLLSPDHSWLRAHYPEGYCRFYPSCSAYALQGLRVDGLVALPQIVARLLKCHPWSAGGLHEYQSVFNEKDS